MLSSLSIRDLVLFGSVEASFSEGLSVLTGETGAGKSILLDALGLALGGRADSNLVAAGKEQGMVAAHFLLEEGHPARLLAARGGLDLSDELLLRRHQGRDGRTRAFVNDQPVTIGFLKEIGETLIEIHGQQDTRILREVSSHREMLDAFGDLEEEARAVLALYESWRSAREAQERFVEEAKSLRGDSDNLRHVLAEMERIAPEEGLEDALVSERALYVHGARFLEGVEEILGALEGERGLLRFSYSGAQKIERLSEQEGGEKFSSLLEALKRGSLELEDARKEAEALRAAFSSADRGRLEAVETRLFDLRELARKHGLATDGLSELRAQTEAKISRLSALEEEEEAVVRAEEEARARYGAAAESLSQGRAGAAEKLAEAVNKELPPLRLEHARFSISLERRGEGDPTPWGLDKVRFLAATNPGQEAGALERIASGGELSRFMLALKLALAQSESSRGAARGVLIFDEIDTGLSGAAAESVGQRLARLAASAQILIVTHAAQIAALANHHLHVLKETDGASTFTRLEILQGAERREEIARMIAGQNITGEARAAAMSLMRSAS